MELKHLKNSDLWEKFNHLFKVQDVPAKTTLLNAGQVANKIYFVEKGCLRVWFNNNGKDVTFQFFFEGESVSSIESFKTKQPSLFTIESIEPCTLYAISYKDFEFLVEHSVEVQKIVAEQTFERLLLYQHLFLSRIKDNPEKRYKDLLNQYPKLLQRVPQHFIASYLGITSVSLSRIRNRR